MQREFINANRELASIREALEDEKNIIEIILFSIGDCVSIFDQGGSRNGDYTASTLPGCLHL